MPNDFVDQLLQRLFGRKGTEDQGEAPTVSERLNRNEAYLERYTSWLDSNRYAAVLLRLKSLHTEAGETGSDFFHLYQSPQANGFFFDQQTGVEPEEFSFLMDHFRDATLDQGYSLYTSDVKISEKSNSVQRVERHYLKPSIPKELVAPIDQRYGNVLMEFVSYNDRPAYLKVMVNRYSDRNYTEALPYGELAERLFSPISSGQ